MKHRFHINAPFVAGELVTLKGDELHHAMRVVRVREGEAIELFDGRGNGAAAIIEKIEPFSARITDLVPSRESPLAIDLAMSIINLEKFELVLQKATELGVRAIVPLITDRIEIRVERFRGKAERWEKIVFEAVKQSGRSVVPRLEAPATFDDVVVREGLRVVYDADVEPSTALTNVVAATLFIGPEGGFSEREVALARDAGAAFARLGPRRLRAETAAIVACTTVYAGFGDLH
ncbi:MAG: rRNA (uracil1498-N3)-methyltransferase [Acidobacteriota bacterium]|jgi:16S rRNA (uracil1498-N3)-methyltransferase|nr:rRNA (uracil1498-N3)-methyltransferase [Acidobacteriota bacterium]